MASSYYTPCKELALCEELIEKHWNTQCYDKCFEGHLALAEQGYPLAECQVGYFYLKGLGVEQNAKQAFYWTQRAAVHGDWDGQYNLASFYEEGVGVARDPALVPAGRAAKARAGTGKMPGAWHNGLNQAPVSLLFIRKKPNKSKAPEVFLPQGPCLYAGDYLFSRAVSS